MVNAQADAQIQTVVIPAQARGNAKKRANAVDACKKHQPQETSKPEISTGHHQLVLSTRGRPPWRPTESPLRRAFFLQRARKISQPNLSAANTLLA
jgi:hypothetical protein